MQFKKQNFSTFMKHSQIFNIHPKSCIFTRYLYILFLSFESNYNNCCGEKPVFFPQQLFTRDNVKLLKHIFLQRYRRNEDRAFEVMYSQIRIILVSPGSLQSIHRRLFVHALTIPRYICPLKILH